MRSIKFAAFCHFLVIMFGIISKLSLKMQRNDLILPVAVSLLHETITNLDALMIRPVPNGHLKWFMNMLEESGVDDEVQFQGNTLKGSLDGTSKRGGAHTASFQLSTRGNRVVSKWSEGEVWLDAQFRAEHPTLNMQYCQ